MTRLLFPALLSLFVLIAATAAEPVERRSRELIASLGLEPLPGESGFFAVIGRSAQSVRAGDRPLAAQSQIYYLLTRDLPLNYLHWLASDDTHVLLEGGPLDYYIFHPEGRVEKLTLGRNHAAGERLVIAIPGGCWKAIRLRSGASHGLMANVLSPEWTPDRAKIGAGADFIARYRGAAPWSDETFLRELIGPNATDSK